MNMHPAIRESLAAHEALRMLGFQSEDIYLMIQKHPETEQLVPTVILKTQGKQFYITTGIWDRPEEEFYSEWDAACQAWNETLTKPEMDEIWYGSVVQQTPVQLVMALRAKGIVCPKHAMAQHSNPRGGPLN